MPEPPAGTGIIVALKLILGASGEGREDRERLLREARAAAAITPQDVAAVYEVGDHEGTPCLATELIDGKPLSSVLSAAIHRPHTREVVTGRCQRGQRQHPADVGVEQVGGAAGAAGLDLIRPGIGIGHPRQAHGIAAGLGVDTSCVTTTRFAVVAHSRTAGS